MDDWQEDVRARWKEALREAHTVLAESREPEWVDGDPETRQHLVRLVAENRMVAQGYVPSSWRYSGQCRRCGIVPLEEPVSEPLVGCPWCAVGAKPRVFTYL